MPSHKSNLGKLLGRARGISTKSAPDVYVISYPRSGRNWLRALIARSLSEIYGIPETDSPPKRLVTGATGLLRTSFDHAGTQMRKRVRYQDLSFDESRFRNSKVVFITRNIKDTLVSAYFQASKRKSLFDGTLAEFIRSDEFGAMKILTFHKLWHENRHVPREFKVLRYEDFHRNPEANLEVLLKFLGAGEVDEAVLASSVEQCSFQNTRIVESRTRSASRKAYPDAGADPESFKARKGLVGGYAEYLSREDIGYIDELLETHGCELSQEL